jgi:hypothetical protein
MRRIAMLLGLFVSIIAPLSAQIHSNQASNPGFEQPGVWSSWDGAEPGVVSCTYTTQNRHGGQYAAQITATQKPIYYGCFDQGLTVPDDDSRPDYLSFWYCSPLANASSYVLYFRGANGEDFGYASGLLPASQAWARYTTGVDTPIGTRDITAELRVCDQGTYVFDDVWLGQSEGTDLLFVGITRDQLPALWQPSLTNIGYPAARQKFVPWDNLTPAVLKTARAVMLVTVPRCPRLTAQDTAIADMLVEYVNNGGGLLLGQSWPDQLFMMTLPMNMANRFGAQILLEQVKTLPENTTQIGIIASDIYSYSSGTNQIPSSPWSGGVSSVWYPSYDVFGEIADVLAFLPTNQAWAVTLKAGEGAYTTTDYRSGLQCFDQFARTNGYAAGTVPLAGMRDYGAGRVGYIGFYTPLIFSRTQDETYETYMQGSVGDRPSNLLQFYVNAFSWLGSNADALTAVTLAPLPPSVASQYTTDWKLLRGIIGPRTTYSSGSSSPSNYVAAAKSAGLDYIVFLEDFAALKQQYPTSYAEAFEQLRMNCAALSSSNFLAVPGITYRNDQGNHEFAFGTELMLPSSFLLDSTGTNFATSADMTWLYFAQGFWNVSGWYLFNQNPYPFYDSRAVCAIAAVTQQGSNILERLPEAHAYQARSGQCNWPLALNLMTSASQVSLVGTGAAYVNVIGANGIAQLHTFFGTPHGFDENSSTAGLPPFGTMSLTRGPIIQLSQSACGGSNPTGDQYYHPYLQSWPLTLSVTSTAALSEVLLYDGDRVIRRFHPNATTFDYATSLGKEKQKSIWVQATDLDGKEAICRDIYCNAVLLYEFQCSDRNNQLLGSSQLRSDGSEFKGG